MIRYRLCYAKYGDAKYVSHLDLIRLFTRAFKRAGIRLTYSEGFNPHPKMAIGLPLSVGVTSECEYMDAETEHALTGENIEKLNRVLPLGIHISGAAERTPGMKKLADIRWAAYTVTVTGAPLDAQQIEAFMERADVIVEKKTKRKTTEADILPDIANLALSCAEADGAVLSMILSAGPSANLKPELVVSAMEQYIPGFFVTDVDIHRTKILADDGRALM